MTGKSTGGDEGPHSPSIDDSSMADESASEDSDTTDEPTSPDETSSSDNDAEDEETTKDEDEQTWDLTALIETFAPDNRV
jgi:hypothetical protein